MSQEPTSSLRPGCQRTSRTLGVFFCALAIGILTYALLGPLSEGVISTPAPQGYYGLLTDAFLAGQTYLKVKPDPALKLLENPWAGHQGIPRLHDATYYHDRYYLYFSFVPAVLVCVPWKLMTGQFPSDGATTAACATISLVLGSLFLLWAWRQWFSALAPAWLGVGVLLIGLGNGVAYLVSAHSVYPVPISAAGACSMAAFGALGWALTATLQSRRMLALALASIAWGLAVACRPNYFCSLMGLGLAVIWFAAKDARGHGLFSWATLGPVIAGIVPAAVIGLIIAAYNYARFGSVTEFGTTYMFAAQDQRFMAMASFRYLWDNLHIYFAQPVIYGPYFPYLTLRESGLGVLTGAPLALLGLLWPMTLLYRPFRHNPAWVFMGVALLLTFLLNVLSVSLLPTSTERYRADFMPAGILLGLFTAFGLLEWMRARETGRLLPAGRLLLFLITGWTLSHSVLLAFVHNPRPEKVRVVARAANRLTEAVEQAQGKEFGRATMQVTFPAGQIGRREPLVVSGSGQDVLYVWYSGEKEIRIGFHHVGAGGPVSDPFPIEPGREYELELNLGCFYPPLDHPAFANWPENRARLLQRQLVVYLDGHVLLNSGSQFYPTHPWDIQFGENSGPYVAPGKFSGTLGPLQRHGLAMPMTFPGLGGGKSPLRLTVRFPPFRYFRVDPLVSTGHAHAGDLLYVAYLAPGKIRFGHDSWGAGAIETSLVDYEPDQPQTLDLEMPSFSTGPDGRPSGRFILRYNGTLLMADDRPAHPADPPEVFLGFNGSDSSAASMNFSGKIDRVEKIAALSLPTDKFQLEPGPVRLVVRFPTGALGRSEPLLVTGRTGAADVIYVQYADESHVRIGYDHWMKGGPVSALIPVNYTATQTIEIHLGSLFPAENETALENLPVVARTTVPDPVLVRLNGQTVLEHQERAYPSQPAEILAGQNLIGASTCDPAFTGRIYLQERLGLKPLDK